MSTVTRRQFLALAAGGGLAAVAVATRPWRALVAPPPPRTAAERLAGLIRNPQSARPIGRAYLALAPREASSPRLAGLIVAGLGESPRAVDAAGDDELRRLVAAGMVADFAQGRTVELDGWMLSRTEARLYALVELA